MQVKRSYLKISDGRNLDHKEYADRIEEIQQITMAANSTFKIPIIYGYVSQAKITFSALILSLFFIRLDHIHGAHYVAKCKVPFYFFS